MAGITIYLTKTKGTAEGIASGFRKDIGKRSIEDVESGSLDDLGTDKVPGLLLGEGYFYCAVFRDTEENPFYEIRFAYGQEARMTRADRILNAAILALSVLILAAAIFRLIF